MRKCANCYGYFEDNKFPWRTGGGYQSYCKPCKRLLDRQYRRSRRELEKSNIWNIMKKGDLYDN